MADASGSPGSSAARALPSSDGPREKVVLETHATAGRKHLSSPGRRRKCRQLAFWQDTKKPAPAFPFRLHFSIETPRGRLLSPSTKTVVPSLSRCSHNRQSRFPTQQPSAKPSTPDFLRPAYCFTDRTHQRLHESNDSLMARRRPFARFRSNRVRSLPDGVAHIWRVSTGSRFPHPRSNRKQSRFR